MPPVSTDSYSVSSGLGLIRVWMQDPNQPRSNSMPELLGGNHGSFSGTQGWKAFGHGGIAVEQASGDSASISCGTISELAGATKVSIFAVGWKNETASNWGVGCFNVNNNRIGVVWVGGTCYTIFENGVASSPGVGSSVSGRITVGATFDAEDTGINRDKLWINGAQQTLGAGGSDPPTSLTASAGDFKIGPYAVGGLYANGMFERVYLAVGQAWNNAQMQRLHYDPDSIFARRNLAVPAALGGAGAAYLLLNG